MRPLHRVAIAALLVLVARAGTTVVAQKVKPPAPVPQTPFTLAVGLNVVTAWWGSTLHAFRAEGMPRLDEVWAETQTDLRAYMALANVDAGADTELVMPGFCQDASGVIYGWLAAYKQGKTGPFYSGKCDAEQRVAASPSDTELAGHDFDKDGRDEIVLKTSKELVVFRLADNKWSHSPPAVLKTALLASDLISYDLKATLADKTTTGHGVVVGDIDGDGASEVVTVLEYNWTPPDVASSVQRTLLLVFDSSLSLKAVEDLNAHAQRADFGMSVGLQHLCLADTDGNGTPEIWLDGYVSDYASSPSRFEHQILSFSGDDGVLTLGAKWYLGWTWSSTAPYLSAGPLGDQAGDYLVLSPLDSRDSEVKIYKPTSGAPMPAPSWSVPRQASMYPKVLGGRLVLVGTLPANKRLRLKKGPFIEVLDFSGVTPETVGYFEKRDDTEGGPLFVLGFDVKLQ